MKLIVKNLQDGGYSELDYVTGTGVVGVSILRVSFDYKDTDDTEKLLRDLREIILPRMPRPTEADFLPEGRR
jgi:hypothetical protein